MFFFNYKGWSIKSQTEIPHVTPQSCDEKSHGDRQLEIHWQSPERTQAVEVADNHPLTIKGLYGEHNVKNHQSQDESKKLGLKVNGNYFTNLEGVLSLDAVIEHLEQMDCKHLQKKRVHLLGLGDVGSTLSIGLKLLGGDVIETLGLYDLNENQKKRWEMELNQVIINPELSVEAIDYDQLFECDVFVFCASKFVPKVGEESGDVRMIQFAQNSDLISTYATYAREIDFKGIFAVVSDPVDLLCKTVWSSSNKDACGVYDYKGLFPEQIMGFGLGVMDGRAAYYADKMDLPYKEKGRVFGPHGSSLVVSADIRDSDDSKSIELTKQVITANLEVRALGFKPYVAPALSSGAASLVAMMSGEWHYSATYVDGTYWGTRNHLNAQGTIYERLALKESLYKRIETSYQLLEETWAKSNL